MERKRRVRAIWGLAGAVLAVAAIVVPLLVLAGSGQATLTAETYADVIRFGVQGAATLQIQIYDLSEKQLWDSGAISGDFVDWDRTDTWGERLANGYYLYRAQAWDASETLILDKTGKVALLPGDNVQLQAAPTPAPVSPLPDNPQSPQPKGQIGTLADTGIFGQVGIGTTGPQAPLDVAGNARFASTAPLNLFRETDQALPAGMWRLGVAGGSFLVDQNTAAAGNFSTYSRRLIISGGGNVGIGTSSPQALLDVAGNARFASTAPLNLFRETDQALPAGMWRLGVAGGGFLIDQNTAGAGNFSTYSRHFIISNGGNVGIGTTSLTAKVTIQATSGDLIAAYNSSNRVFVVKSTGEVRADGAVYAASFTTGSADVAERINTSEWVEAGDVVEIDPDHPGFFRKSADPYSRRVAGIISTSPGVILGNSTDSKMDNWDDNRPVLAIAGRVPTSVTTENGPIAVGDLLVSSSTPGVAMRGDPSISVGAVVGKAMEPLSEGVGSIVVQVMLR